MSATQEPPPPSNVCPACQRPYDDHGPFQPYPKFKDVRPELKCGLKFETKGICLTCRNACVTEECNQCLDKRLAPRPQRRRRKDGEK